MIDRRTLLPLKDRVAVEVATLGPLGYTPLIPGTIGSVVGVGIHAASACLPIGARLAGFCTLVLIALWACGKAEGAMDEMDPKEIILDEAVGMILGLLGAGLNPFLLVAGFAIFRTLDVLKPFPIRWVERRFSGSVSIVGDDLLAGIGTLVGLGALERALPSLRDFPG